MRVEPASEKFGATVYDVRLNSLSDSQFRQIENWWLTFAVLVFPEQHLTREEHVRFTKRFGRLERGLKLNKSAGTGDLSNTSSDGNLLPKSHVARRFHIGNSLWHTDSSYKRIAAKASVLAAHIVPTRGGETQWADMRQGYESLSESMRDWLQDKTAIHSYRFSHAWHGGLEILDPIDLEHLPPVEQPLVKSHPDTGRKVLFVGRHASHIIGEEVRSSRKLLRELTFQAAQAPRIWEHKWNVGDIAIWDNRCVLHRARRYPSDEKRRMVRTTVAGDGPNNEWAV